MVKIENYIVKKDLGIVLANRSFKELTTMKVGGKIKCLYYPNSIENLLDVILYLNQNGKRFFVLGNGSNIIASDRTFKDLVICGKHLDFEVIYQSDSFIVSAFSDLRKINSKLLQKNISTFLNLTGIPATIGGAIVMNAGAFGSNISDHLIWVECIKDGKVIKIYKNDLSFSYRNSNFKNTDIIILSVCFEIIKESNPIIKYQEISKKRKEKHPLEFPNSGSIFKNLSNIKAYKVIQKIDMVNYFIGGATFSEKHANFIVNKNNCMAKDVYKLIILAKKRAFVLEKITLEEEVILLNFPYNIFYKNLNKKLK